VGTQPIFEQGNDAEPAMATSMASSVAAPACTISGPSGTDFFAIAFEIPGKYDAAGKAPPDAGMVQQDLGVLWRTAARKIFERGGEREALHARPDGHGDHVLGQPLLVADIRVAWPREPIAAPQNAARHHAAASASSSEGASAAPRAPGIGHPPARLRQRAD